MSNQAPSYRSGDSEHLELRGARCVFATGPVSRPSDLWIRSGRIVAIGERPAEWPDDAMVLDVRGAIVAPGLIDLQCNGGWGIDLAREPERIDELARRLIEHGVTSFLPTLVSSPRGEIERFLEACRSRIDAVASGGARVLGAHLEGPMLSRSRSGAHDADNLRPAELELIRGWSRAEGVALVTLAPELEGALDVIEELQRRGVVISAGHTTASASQAEAACERGLSLVTHLFNAMEPLHHREPGLVGYSLATSGLATMLIVDRLHVDPLVVRAVWSCKGPDDLVLVSDATAAQGLAAGRATLGDSEVVLGLDGIRDRHGNLAGADLTLDQAVRNLVAITNCPAAAALRCASANPARALGLEHCGRIVKGAEADLVVFDEGLEVVATLVAGEVVYDRGGVLARRPSAPAARA